MSEGGDNLDQDGSAIPTFEAVYKDGQLEMIEINQAYRDEQTSQELNLQTMADSNEIDRKCIQVDSEALNMQLDLLNFTLVRYEGDGEDTYRLVARDLVKEEGVDGQEVEGGNSDDEGTLTCVLTTEDDDQDSTIPGDNETYLMMESSDGETMYLHTTVQAAGGPGGDQGGPGGDQGGEGGDLRGEESPPVVEEKPKMTAEELLLKHTAVQRIRQLISAPISYNRRGRKRKSDLPSPRELLQSPTLKLYLYNCKQCSFKCNAIRELHAHRRLEHTGSCKVKSRSLSGAELACPRCRHKAHSQEALKKHIQERHKTILDDDVMILVDGASMNEQQPTYLNLIDTTTSDDPFSLNSDKTKNGTDDQI